MRPFAMPTRPEKDHEKQFRIIKKLVERDPNTDLRLFAVGSCRGPEDDVFLNHLKQKTKEYGVEDKVQFFVNLPFPEIMKVFERAKFAIHTMNAEHFGIAIVELIAGGMITIAHNSAGPKFDIIKERNQPVGFLGINEDDYVEAILSCHQPSQEAYCKSIVARGREEMKKFSDESFKSNFMGDFKSEFARSLEEFKTRHGTK